MRSRITSIQENTLPSKKQNYTDKMFRSMDKKAALKENEKERKAKLDKTAKLRALRLEKEAEEAAKKPPAKKKKKQTKRGLPPFERESGG